MTRVVPALHDRHAPISLQDAFLDAVEAFEGWQQGQDEPAIAFEDKLIPISSIFGRMRTSDDIAPEKVRLAYSATVGDDPDLPDMRAFTYGYAASRLRELSLEILRDGAR
ncbi:MAG TPA: hypothetical protein VNS02_14105 [Rhizobiaceae bacterium]|nr:hypothetical protein [Rhizobiaceae bacterium]